MAEDFSKVVQTAIATRLAGYKKAGFDTANLANALGAAPQDSGVFGITQPEELMGLLPEDIDSIAKTRSTTAYQKMLTDIGALDFVNKMTGKEEIDRSTSDIIRQEQESKRALAIAKEQGKAGRWQQDPLRLMTADAIERISRGEKVPKAKMALAIKATGGLSSEDSANLIQNIAILSKAINPKTDPEGAENLRQLLKYATKRMESTQFEFEETPKEKATKERTPDQESKFKILRNNPKNKQYTDEQLWEGLEKRGIQ